MQAVIIGIGCIALLLLGYLLYVLFRGDKQA